MRHHSKNILFFICTIFFTSCSFVSNTITIDKKSYEDRLKGFWLGSCIGNWTGLPTENQRTGFPFFTDSDFGKNKFDLITINK